MIEVLEAMASLIMVDITKIFLELQNETYQDPNGSHSGGWTGRIRNDLHYTFTYLVEDVTELKACVFRSSELRLPFKGSTAPAKVCMYCNWALERIDRG